MSLIHCAFAFAMAQVHSFEPGFPGGLACTTSSFHWLEIVVTESVGFNELP